MRRIETALMVGNASAKAGDLTLDVINDLKKIKSAPPAAIETSPRKIEQACASSTQRSFSKMIRKMTI